MFYMEIAHPILANALKTYWRLTALELSIIETIQLIEWCEVYTMDLQKFGVKDETL